MATALRNFIEELDLAIERRREAVTMVIRTVQEVEHTIYLSTCTSMAIPMLYAQWEGCVKECFEMYIEHVSKCGAKQADMHPHMLAFAWSGQFQRLSGKGGVEGRVSFVRRILDGLSNHIIMRSDEKRINTKSNLNFDVFAELCTLLCLRCEHLTDRKRALDALVNRRNSIAHGGRSSPHTVDDVMRDAELVRELMDRVGDLVREAAEHRAYLATSLVCSEEAISQLLS
ncbi:MAE_28990/MAE_18760 family HEPN-like nuclease [Polyangium spumosum]|uniref:RiboL-PSP-HEPN domain-containing protein n=1 Tax=Polyangium spumosum TaxID=889282 RepID=A0A6N7Q8K7_9BACT|nr:MAE_28990/MAE_18760 family HEPN-like nuclease [Polyangium spumosum]MRG98584.1 hypothetical protein [Polyangium spumosum]